MGQLESRVAIITGAGQGIGAATARRLAYEGAKVVVVDINAEMANQVVHSINVSGNAASAFPLDATSTDEVNKFVAKTITEWGHIDILIHCVGAFPRCKVIDMTDENWNSVLDINIGSAFRCIRAVLPHMINNGYGRIVNVTSRMALQGAFAGSHYSAAKAGLIGLTKSLALEVVDYGINVNAISPGVTATPMVLNANTPEWLEEFAQKLPFKRLWEPEDVAESILYLVSDASKYVTGQVLYMWQ
jgi:3-oxoacyl-[acyl-carrier protein] reductase